MSERLYREAYFDTLRKLRALQERVAELQHKDDTRTKDDAIRDALSKLDPKKSDLATIETILRGRNLRLIEGVPVIDLPGDDGEMVMSVSEAIPYMVGRPAEYANLFDVAQHEPTARERLEAKFKDMDMKKYMDGRKNDPNFFDPPPPEPQQ